MPTSDLKLRSSTLRWMSVVLIAIVGSLSIDAMSTASAGTPSADCGSVAYSPKIGTGRIVGAGEVACDDTTPLPYIQIRVKLLRKKIGSPGWVMIARASGSTPTPDHARLFRVKVSRPCETGKYRTAAKFLYRWDATEPWTVYVTWLRSPWRGFLCV